MNYLTAKPKAVVLQQLGNVKDAQRAEGASYNPLHKSLLHIQYTYMMKRVKQIIYPNIQITNLIFRKLSP